MRKTKTENLLINKLPRISDEWDIEKNEGEELDSISTSSKRKYWWKCNEGHSYNTSAYCKSLGTGCPYCSGRLAIKGKNDLKTCFPEIAKEWDYEKNGELRPDEFTYGSGKKVWWKCANGHSYESYIHNRTNVNVNSGCPYCSHYKVLPGFNDLLTEIPDVEKYWDYEKNEVLPCEVVKNSRLLVWWKCDKGHSYKAKIANKIRTINNCSICSGSIVQSGVNDLFTTNPELFSQWDFEKNTIDPYTISQGSNRKVHWICELGHEYIQVVNYKTRGHGCPFCAPYNSKLLIGFNDLQTKYPNIAKEWDNERNDLSADLVLAKTSKKYFWLCKYGHSYSATVANRVNGTSCPICTRKRRTSLPEQAIFYYLTKSYSEVENSYKDIFPKTGMELDIYIHDINVGIEYDGKTWHSNERREIDVKKYKICKKNGITLIRIKEQIDWMDDADIIIKSDYDNDISAIEKMLLKLFETLKLDGSTIDLNRDVNAIRNSYYSFLDGTSLEDVFPQLALEWDYEKNYPITPRMVSFASAEKYYWKCDNGHESYLQSVANHTGNRGCPVCKNDRLKVRKDRTVFQHSLDGTLIKMFSSIKQAEKETGISHKMISAVALRKRKQTGNYIWRYEDDNEFIDIKEYNVDYCRQVNQYSIRGYYVGTFENLLDIKEKKPELYSFQIYKVCQRQTKTTNGYCWRFADDCDDMRG